MLTLNIYKDQKTVVKTVTVDGYDIMYGTVEDIFEILEGVEDVTDQTALLKLVAQNRQKLNALLLDVFPDLTAEDLKHVKLKELVNLFIDLFKYVKDSFRSKN